MRGKDNRAFIKHVKGLFNPHLLSSLRAQFIQLEQKQSADGVSEREKGALMRGESTDYLRMQSAWYQVWQDPKKKDVLLENVFPYLFVTYPVQVRHVRKPHHHVPWHQDIGYMRLLGDRGPRQVITCFIPLEPEPAKCTTIQFAKDISVENSNKEYPHVALEGFGAGIENCDFKEQFHFDLNLGDALVFGDHALHRTYLPENCQIERRSLEFRLILPEQAMAHKDYFDIEKQQFVKVNQKMGFETSTVA